jgi:type II secretory ATPase GspE/PulE/Tfp pilus assembly ATPase PilB-like protein
MGVEPFLIASAVQTVIAQRLVRRLCPLCRVAVPVSPQIEREFALSKEECQSGIYEARGCKSCRMSGYDGRLAIAEFLMMNDELGGLIMQRASAAELRQLALQRGMKTLRSNGWEKVRAGLTSAQEVLRVIQ